MGCDKDQEVCMHQGTSPGGLIRINVDLGLGKMTSPLDCIYIIFYDIITSYSLLILSPVATSKSEPITWPHKQNGVPYSISPKRVIPENVITFNSLGLELVIEKHRLQI